MASVDTLEELERYACSRLPRFFTGASLIKASVCLVPKLIAMHQDENGVAAQSKDTSLGCEHLSYPDGRAEVM